jgi:hypothetical protein
MWLLLTVALACDECALYCKMEQNELGKWVDGKCICGYVVDTNKIPLKVPTLGKQVKVRYQPEWERQ